MKYQLHKTQGWKFQLDSDSWSLFNTCLYFVVCLLSLILFSHCLVVLFCFYLDLRCEAQWFWNCIIYKGVLGLVLFGSNSFFGILSDIVVWLFEIILACFVLWICVCRASVFGRSHLFFLDNAASRLGCTQSRHSGCTCSENKIQKKAWYKKYKIQKIQNTKYRKIEIQNNNDSCRKQVHKARDTNKNT